jgi:geranylgeranyl pyrophosphate synthase
MKKRSGRDWKVATAEIVIDTSEQIILGEINAMIHRLKRDGTLDKLFNIIMRKTGYMLSGIISSRRE